MGRPEPVHTRRLTIFHTSDMHNKLDKAAAARLNELRNSTPDSLMLDSGDAIWAGNAFWRPGGEPVFDLMNSVPYDAMCMGNREYHILDAGIRAKLARAAFPVLSANLVLRSGGAAARGEMVAPYVLFARSDLRIAVFGLTIPCVPRGALLSRISDACFDQPEAAGARAAVSLRGQCDVLVALTHIGLERDRDLARSASGIDLVLGGHTHTVTQEPESAGNTVILHSGSHARWVRRVDIEVGTAPRVVGRELIPLQETGD